MDSTDHDFTPAERELHDKLVRAFGVLRAGIRPNEMAAGWLERVRNDGLFREIKRAAFRDVGTYRALTAAEAAGTVVRITEPEPPPALVFQRSEMRNLENYRTAKAAAAKVGKELAYE